MAFTRGDAADLARAMGEMWRQRELRAELSHLAWERARGPLAVEQATAKRIAFYQRVVEKRRRLGPGDIQGRLLSLPPAHSFRLLVASALARGEADLLPAFVPQAELPPPALTPVDRLLKQLGTLAGGQRFYLYGAGRHTARLLMEQCRWEELGHKLLGLIDDHPRYAQVPEAYGMPVISCAAAAENVASSEVVVLSTDAFEEQFWANTAKLREGGVTVLRLYT